MSLSLGDRVLRGEVCNTSWYSTDGWLEVRGIAHPVRLDLTGNCEADLAGCRIRFEVPDAEAKAASGDSPSPVSPPNRSVRRAMTDPPRRVPGVVRPEQSRRRGPPQRRC
jgi:hypothetical protein